MNYEIKKINWIDTIFAHMEEANSITVQILVKAWSIYENKENNWISHFLEHMFFKWWKKYKNAKKVAEVVDEIWWESNAFTWEEYAWYYIKSAPQHIEKAIDILSDMLVYPTFPKTEIEREKWVVIQEIMMYEDMPNRLVIDLWKRFYYWDNSFWWAILGTEENVKSFKQDDLLKHKLDLYCKDNMVIVVAGKLDNIKNVENMIHDYFKDSPEKKSLNTPKLKQHIPNEHIGKYDKKTQQNHLVIWAKWFNMTDKDRYGANLLWVILGGNMSSILFQEIREKRWLCYYISWWHYDNQQDWIFLIRAWMEKQRFDYGLKSIFEQIENVANGKVTEEEFKKSLWYIEWKTQMWIETSDQMADFLWEQYLLQHKIETLEQILKNYEKLWLDDIKKVWKKLNSKNLFSYYIC